MREWGSEVRPCEKTSGGSSLLQLLLLYWWKRVVRSENEWVNTDGKVCCLFSFITTVAVFARRKWFMFVTVSLNLMRHTLAHCWQSRHEKFPLMIYDNITTYYNIVTFSFSTSSVKEKVGRMRNSGQLGKKRQWAVNRGLIMLAFHWTVSWSLKCLHLHRGKGVSRAVPLKIAPLGLRQVVPHG